MREPDVWKGLRPVLCLLAAASTSITFQAGQAYTEQKARTAEAKREPGHVLRGMGVSSIGGLMPGWDVVRRVALIDVETTAWPEWPWRALTSFTS